MTRLRRSGWCGARRFLGGLCHDHRNPTYKSYAYIQSKVSISSIRKGSKGREYREGEGDVQSGGGGLINSGSPLSLLLLAKVPFLDLGLNTGCSKTSTLPRRFVNLVVSGGADAGRCPNDGRLLYRGGRDVKVFVGGESNVLSMDRFGGRWGTRGAWM